MDEGAGSAVGVRINSDHFTDNQVADFAKIRTQTGGLAPTNDANSGGSTAMAQSGELFNIFNLLAKGIDDFNKNLNKVKGIDDFNKNLNKVKVVFELTLEQQEELLGIALFISQQQELESDAELGLMTDEELKNLEQVKLNLDKYCSLIEKIINLHNKTSSQK